MASNKFFILAFFVVFNVLSSINLSLAARNLLQTTTPSIPTVPVVPTLPKPTPLPPLPTLPLPTTIPSLPNLPTIPSIPQFNFPQIPNIPSLPTIPTTIPSIPFFSPPPSRGCVVGVGLGWWEPIETENAFQTSGVYLENLQLCIS
nr:protein PELPK2-like [Quercus suber]